jgi:hypothetical protein
LVFLLGCGPTAARVDTRRSNGKPGSEAYDIDCPSRGACEAEARRLCPSGYRVSSESFNEGTSITRANAERTGPLPEQKWSGQPSGRMRVDCY